MTVTQNIVTRNAKKNAELQIIKPGSTTANIDWNKSEMAHDGIRFTLLLVKTCHTVRLTMLLGSQQFSWKSVK